MNQKLIKQLQEGKIAVHNDATLEELEEVINKAFPKDDDTLHGVFTYYQKSENYASWIGHDKTNLPSYSVKEFLKEETMEKKKIVGWKVPYDMYEGYIKTGDILSTNVTDKYAYWYINGKINNDICIPLEFVKTWEPVYEQEFKVGDYVTVIKAVRGFNGEEGKTYKIFGWQEKHENKFYYTEDCQPTINTNEVKVRLATPEEIEKKVSTIKIGDYEVKFTPNGVVIENVKYTSVEIATLADLIKRGQIKTLRVGCMGQYTVNLELLEKILSKF
jgi:hypothetical protein